MIHALKTEQVEGYHDKGYLFPMDVFNAEEVTTALDELAQAQKDAEASGNGGQFSEYLRTRAHMTMPFVCGIAAHPGLLDRVASILGFNLMLWGADFFIKTANTDKIVSWHQDLTYWGLGETDEEVTAWVALSEVTVESGCMRFVPGSHKQQLLPHRDTFSDTNLLSRGQEIAVDVDENKAINVELKPGQVSFHHGRIFHASGPNRSDYDRVAVAFRYITPGVEQQTAERDYGMMMRGVDRGRNWNHLARPSRNFDAGDLKLREEVIADMAAALAKGADQTIKVG